MYCILQIINPQIHLSCPNVISLLTWAIGMTPPIIGGGAPTIYGIGGIPGIPIGG